MAFPVFLVVSVLGRCNKEPDGVRRQRRSLPREPSYSRSASASIFTDFLQTLGKIDSKLTSPSYSLADKLGASQLPSSLVFV